MADTFIKRLLGWHARGPLGPDEGIVLRPCRAVHTLFMSQAIDVVFLDPDGQALRVIQGMPRGRLAWVPGACMVVELPAGYCGRHTDYQQRISAALRENKAVRMQEHGDPSLNG